MNTRVLSLIWLIIYMTNRIFFSVESFKWKEKLRRFQQKLIHWFWLNTNFKVLGSIHRETKEKTPKTIYSRNQDSHQECRNLHSYCSVVWFRKEVAIQIFSTGDLFNTWKKIPLHLWMLQRFYSENVMDSGLHFSFKKYCISICKLIWKQF